MLQWIALIALNLLGINSEKTNKNQQSWEAELDPFCFGIVLDVWFLGFLMVF